LNWCFDSSVRRRRRIRLQSHHQLIARRSAKRPGQAVRSLDINDIFASLPSNPIGWRTIVPAAVQDAGISLRRRLRARSSAPMTPSTCRRSRRSPFVTAASPVIARFAASGRKRLCQRRRQACPRIRSYGIHTSRIWLARMAGLCLHVGMFVQPWRDSVEYGLGRFCTDVSWKLVSAVGECVRWAESASGSRSMRPASMTMRRMPPISLLCSDWIG
jgi:hypothetical protein